MSTERIVIRIGCGLLLVSGAACALAPGFFAQLAGISATGPALTDLRAVYGGTQLALAGFLFWCDRDPALHTAGLLALLFFCSDVAIVRSLGLFLDGGVTAYQLQNLAVEVVSALGVGAVLLRGRAALPQVA